MTEIDEPLNLSAPLAWHMAPTTCHQNPITGANCSWNHRLWQCLRLIGLGGSPEINAGFYSHAFHAVASTANTPRVLISGAADYSMLAHVLAAFAAENAIPSVTIVDICETPLRLNRWYAERSSRQIETECCDITEFGASGFDAICTHSFLGQIPFERRPAVLAAWRRMLRSGGRVITVDRIRPVNTTSPVGFTDLQARSFCTAVSRKAQELGVSLGIDPAELMRAAELYAANQALYPVRSREEVGKLFENAGFTIDELICGPNEINSESADSGPAIPARTNYARVIARRR